MRTKVQKNLLKLILCAIKCLGSQYYILSKSYNNRICEESWNSLSELLAEQRAAGGRGAPTRAEASCMLRMAASGIYNPGKGLQAKIKIQDDYN